MTTIFFFVCSSAIELKSILARLAGLTGFAPPVTVCSRDRPLVLRLPSPNNDTYKVYVGGIGATVGTAKLRNGIPEFEESTQPTNKALTTLFHNGTHVMLIIVEKTDWNVCIEGTSLCDKSLLPQVKQYASNGMIYGVLKDGGMLYFTQYRVIDKHSLRTTEDIDYKSNAPWIGCPQRMCQDGTLDAAASGPGEGYTLYRGQYSWKVSHIPGQELSKPEVTKLGAIDAAFRYGKTLYAFRDHNLIVYDGNTQPKRDQKIVDTFPAIVGQVDAAFINQSVVHIIQDNIVTSYNFKPNTTMKPAGRRRYINDKWKQLPGSPEAAAMHLDHAYFFKNGFFFTFSRNDSVDVNVVQGHFFNCDDSFYSGDTVKLDFFQNLTEFQVYRGRFLPPADVTTGDVPITEPLTTKPGGSRSIAVIVFISIVVAVLAILAAIFVYSRTKNKPAIEKRNSLIDTLTNEALTTASNTPSLPVQSNLSVTA
ncbi:hypothetical protein HDE_12138 [Halotydeus destructor]|nr:hypothetical protein HDE_12138 [Halotydeus destructor]